MNVNYDYLRHEAETKLAELRREADEYRLASSLTAQAKAARASRRTSGRTWFRLRARAARRAAARPTMAEPVRIPRPMPPTDEELRRSA